mmetsp:Transcript_16113/g.19686  ORF Transcript_16113/g.19686 Transcript_16113/m.19686 type:complete len:457 (+) Transcript_16113:117-1487(+)
MSTFHLENAKSGRASCKKCKEKIAKGELRIGETSEVPGSDYTTTKWIHVECFNIPRKLSKITVEEFVDEHLEDNSDDKVLEDETKRQEIIEKISTKASKTAKKEDDAKVDSYIAVVKSNAELLDAKNDDEGPPKKKIKLSNDDKAKAEAYLKYKDMKTDELKDLLSWNKIHKTGKKEFLLIRAIDGNVYGRIPKCAACGEGRPRISDDGSEIICSGYFDEDNAAHKTCGTKMKVENARRIQPWFDHEPTEEEKEATWPEEKQNVDSANDGIPKAFKEAIKKLDWDRSNKDNIKKLAADLCDLCSSDTSPIAIDDKNSRTTIGQIIVQNKTASSEEVLGLIVEKYGIKEKKEAAAKEKSAILKASCEVASNAPIYEILLEFSEIYFKEKNTNAGNSYRKVANVVKELDFEITSDNAQGLGKGKTKVAGIGKGSAEKIHEFLTTGTIEKLEQKRAAQV